MDFIVSNYSKFMWFTLQFWNNHKTNSNNLIKQCVLVWRIKRWQTEPKSQNIYLANQRMPKSFAMHIPYSSTKSQQIYKIKKIRP